MCHDFEGEPISRMCKGVSLSALIWQQLVTLPPLQTAIISYDYLTAFKNVELGTDEYSALKSKVCYDLLVCCAPGFYL